MKQIEAGDTAPDFTGIDQQGREVRLADFLGHRPVVLYFYPKDGTPVCTQQACAFRDAYEQFTEAGAAVIGISSDTLRRHEAFAETYRLPFTLISDADGALRRLFGVPKSLGFLPGRVTYVIDKQGVVRHRFVSQLQPGRHVEEALRVLATLED